MEIAVAVPLSIVGAGIGLWIVLGYVSGRAFVENAKFDLVKSHKKFEVRRYHPSVAAIVHIDDDNLRHASSAAFSRIAGFIFGGNLPRESSTTAGSALPLLSTAGKGTSIAMTSPVVAIPSGRIAMTAPVVAEVRSSGGVDVAFIMPSKFKTVSDLPVPRDSAVHLQALPARWEAVTSWHGAYATQTVFESRTCELLSNLRAAGYTPTAAPENAGKVVDGTPVLAKSYSYDPPWTPWFMKKNEVAIVIDAPSDIATIASPRAGITGSKSTVLA